MLGFRRLGFEAVNKALQLGHLVLLARKSCLLLAHLFGAHGLEAAVVATVAGQSPVVDVQRHLRHAVQKFAVVADDDEGAVVALQPAFEPNQGVEVEVVGGLVEHEDVAGAHEGARQLQTHAPAARKAVDRLHQLVGVKAQTHEQALCAGLRVVVARVVQGGVGFGHTHTIAGGFGLGHSCARLHQARVTRHHKVGRGLVGFGHVLCHLA